MHLFPNLKCLGHIKYILDLNHLTQKSLLGSSKTSYVMVILDGDNNILMYSVSRGDLCNYLTFSQTVILTLCTKWSFVIQTKNFFCNNENITLIYLNMTVYFFHDM